ncbi:hypothetical protein CTI12_AA143300 [Artemisia annua]|uniref:Uncharacterized protein n=1 Tax=Artemisia annua TaxID=35608 RepID=A0A2U1PK34_ARTAN|nr:hypothetical protein CTI12_AA143300 [Artemisia annua]
MLHFGKKRRSSTMVLLFIFFWLLQICVLNNECCSVRAIRILSSSSKELNEIKRANLFKKFFNGDQYRQKMNTTSVSKGKGFQENKRMIPSCPDALHN